MTGHLAFNRLRPAHETGILATLDGDLKAARLDETYVNPSMIFGPSTIATAAGVTAALAVLLKLLVGLFTKISPDKALEHERRRTLQDYIVSNPGATFRELLRGTGIPAGTARHHLTILRRSGLTVEKQYRSTLRFFENHGKFDETWAAVVLLREPELEKLHSWIMDNPSCKQMDVLDAMIEDGWTRSTTQHRLQRLIDGGLVTVRPQGRLKLYTAHERPIPEALERVAGWRDASYA